MKDKRTVTDESSVCNDRMRDEGVDVHPDHYQAVEMQHRCRDKNDLQTLKIVANSSTMRPPPRSTQMQLMLFAWIDNSCIALLGVNGSSVIAKRCVTYPPWTMRTNHEVHNPMWSVLECNCHSFCTAFSLFFHFDCCLIIQNKSCTHCTSASFIETISSRVREETTTPFLTTSQSFV